MSQPQVGKWGLSEFLVIIGSILELIFGIIYAIWWGGAWFFGAVAIVGHIIGVVFAFLLLVVFGIIPIPAIKIPKTAIVTLIFGIIIAIVSVWWAGVSIIVGAILMFVYKE